MDRIEALRSFRTCVVEYYAQEEASEEEIRQHLHRYIGWLLVDMDRRPSVGCALFLGHLERKYSHLHCSSGELKRTNFSFKNCNSDDFL